MNEVEFIRKFIPEYTEKLILRFKILDYISTMSPIGRRNIASYFSLSERTIRNEMEFLSDMGFIEIIKSGAIITDFGNEMLYNLRDTVNKFRYNEDISGKLKEILNIKEVIVCDSYDDEQLGKRHMSKIAAEYFLNKLSDNLVIGISGGTTVKSFVEVMNSRKKFNNLSVIPARGSLGNGLEYQSNIVANELSKKLNANFFGTFLPDYLDELTFDKLKSLNEVRLLTEYLEKIDILVFGVGRADKMAKRRSLSEKEIEILNENGAVSEAFGNYFDIYGNIVFSSNTIGLDIYKYLKIKDVIAVAGYGDKEKAIISICRIRKDMTLITDRLTAEKILKIL